MLAENCCCNAVLLKECGAVCCGSCPMLGFVQKLKQATGFSQVMGVYSVFVGLVTQLCSPSNACVERGHMLCAS